LNLGVRLLFFVLGFFLATTGPTLLSRDVENVTLYCLGDLSYSSIRTLNGAYSGLGIFLTIAGLVLIITAFYRRGEKFPIIKTWFETECW
jgi:hypothetical protein